MTSISIIGAGRAAGVHAAAFPLATDVDLVGIAGRRIGQAAELARQAEVAELTFDDAIARSNAVVVAVPPADTPAVLDAIGSRVAAVLVETPSAPSSPELDDRIDRPRTMIGANLLHAPATRRTLSEIARIDHPHHFTLRSQGPRPDWGCHGTPRFGGGVLLDPGCRLLAVLLAAIAAPVVSVIAKVRSDAQQIDTSASLRLLTDQAEQPEITIQIGWGDDGPTTSLEVAGDEAVIQLELSPPPTLEINGEPVSLPGSGNPFVDLGYAAQITRLGAVARGDAAPWPEYQLASGLLDIASAAAFSSTHQGIAVSPGAGYPQQSVWNILAEP